MGNIEKDITINLKDNEYVLTNAVIDPYTKNNISTYIVKGNVPISFNLANADMNREGVKLRVFYYRKLKNRNTLNRCCDIVYPSGKEINIIPSFTYEKLKSKNWLSNCIIIIRLEYDIKALQFGPVKNDVRVNKSAEFAFKIVSEDEFNMYKKMEEEKIVEEENGEIKRPKRPKD